MSRSFNPADFAGGHTSRLPNFSQRSLPERAAIVAQWTNLGAQEQAVLLGLAGLQPGQADQLVENVVGTFALPLAIAVNFQINGSETLVPMVTGEPGMVAACSLAANLARANGGFKCRLLSAPLASGLVQVVDLPDPLASQAAVREAGEELRAEAERAIAAQAALGAGVKHLSANTWLETAAGPMLSVRLELEAGTAARADMARAVQAACEAVAPRIADLTGGRVAACVAGPQEIRRLTAAECTITPDLLDRPATESEEITDGRVVARSIAEQSALGAVDPLCAAGQRRMIMGAVGAVAVATGHDAPAVTAWSPFDSESPGRRDLATWKVDAQGRLHGSIALLLPVSLPAIQAVMHPGVQVALRIMSIRAEDDLAYVMAAVGLAQSLASLHAAVHPPILPGHRERQARAFARAAGAEDDLAEQVAQRMLAENNVKLVRAQELVAELAHGDRP